MSSQNNSVSKWLEEAAEFNQRPILTQGGIYVYGAGELGKLAAEYCEMCGINILGFIDRKASGTLVGIKERYRVRHPLEIPQSEKRETPIAVAVATSSYKAISKALERDGWAQVLPFYQISAEKRLEHPLRNGWLIGETTNEEKATLVRIRNQLDDKKSQDHYDAFVAWHASYTEIDLENQIDTENRYIIPEIIELLQKRANIFVDVGSCRGESISQISKKIKYFKKYVLIEPDTESRDLLKSYIDCSELSHSSIEILDFALGEVNTRMNFLSQLGYCSQLNPNAKEKKIVRTLDSLNLSVDYLKIHTEGSELAVFWGGRETIEKHRPLLAISCYHDRSGLFSLIPEVMRNCCEYKWWFRLHSYQGTGAFLYGAPMI